MSVKLISREKVLSTLSNPKNLIILWVVIGLFSGVIKYFHGPVSGYNNYLIFRGFFFHFFEQLPLYIQYPQEYFDQSYYLPPFAFIIAPFAILPIFIGLPLWVGANSAFLAYAINKLKINIKQKAIIFILCAHELMTAAFMQQFNISIAAILILSYAYIEEGKEIKATFFILAGTFVKLYGIVGCAFFLFSRNKIKFILSFIGWSLFFLTFPMLFTSVDYILEQYKSWFTEISLKHDKNMYAPHQNISLLGMIRRITHHTYSDFPIIATGAILFAAPYLRFKSWASKEYRLLYLASALIFTVIFSSSSESSTYIIAIIGAVIWFIIKKKQSTWDWILLVLVLVITSFSPSDLFPDYLQKNYIVPYSLKALPCVLVWFTIVWEQLTKKFDYAD